MNWYTLFRQHILDRGIEYYEDGNVVDFQCTENSISAHVDGTDIYDVEIMVEGEEVIDMYCSCPYARGGKNCKHMAAVLFRFEEMLQDNDEERASVEIDNGYNYSQVSFADRCKQKREDVTLLVSKIPEKDVRELLINILLTDEDLRHTLQMKYAFKMNSKLMLELRNEIDQIVNNNCRGGFVDWYHASDFTDELSHFLDTKVKLLIENNCLQQAFELTNVVFDCIGNIDMDDSDGSSAYVANSCYDCWKQIIENADDALKTEIKKWFEEHRDGYVVDYFEEYIDEIYLQEFGTLSMIEDEIQELDTFISRARGNDCGKYYSVHYGYENPIIKRINYMIKMHCSEEQIAEYKQANRRFFVIREMEISEAIEKEDFDAAINLLLESKKLDADYEEQLKKYSEQLISIYCELKMTDECCLELIEYLKNHYQSDLTYAMMLKALVNESESWNQIVCEIVNTNPYEYFVCSLLFEEKRYEELMSKIEKSSNRVDLLNIYEKSLRKRMPKQVIEIYESYIIEEAERAYDRKGYSRLMPYLKKISRCEGGDVVARGIADAWKQNYKRRSAMMDELKKAGF